VWWRTAHGKRHYKGQQAVSKWDDLKRGTEREKIRQPGYHLQG
jgi:hypothetical protein